MAPSEFFENFLKQWEARAKATGKGFAVVSDEVSKGTKIAYQTAESLFQVVKETNAVAATIEKISAAASQELSGQSQILKRLASRFRLLRNA